MKKLFQKKSILFYIFQGVYHVENKVFDLSLFSRVPMDPSKLHVNLTVFDYITNDKNEKVKRLFVCLEVEVVLTPSRPHRRTTINSPLSIN